MTLPRVTAASPTKEATLPKILIVDDDRTTTNLLATLFQLEGFEVLTNPRPDDLGGLVRAQHPDVLIIDCHLADRDGVDLLRELRAAEDLGALPVIMTSGLDRSAECLREGASAFVMKPFPPAELIEAVRQALEPRPAGRAGEAGA
jgi:DNA-binding response OmpR family regulator